MSALPNSPSHLSHRTHRTHHSHHHTSDEPDVGFLPDPGTLMSMDGGVDAALAESFAPRGDEVEMMRSRSRFREEQEGEGAEDPLLRDGEEATDEEDEEDAEDAAWEAKPWYRRPSPWWLIPTLLVSSTLTSMTTAPKVEVYNKLVCQEHRPEYSSHPIPPAVPHDGTPEEDILPGTVPGPLVPHPEESEKLEMLWAPDEGWKWAPDDVSGQAGGVKPPSALCRADPVVQAEVAKMTTAMMTVMGILAVLTTGWWSSLSDIRGRTFVLAVSIFGVLITDANFLLTAHFSSYLPGGYRFLVVGPMIDGLLGGYPTATAATHAYVGDCTPAHARARIFGLYAGLAFTGIALGPTIGALVIRATGDLLSVFYITTAGHILYAIAITLIIPESLSPHARRRIARRVKERQRESEEAEVSISRMGSRARVVHGVWRFIRPMFGFLSPLMLFAPRKRQMGEGGYGKRSWNLTFLAMCYGLVGMLIGLYSFKFQYAQLAFGWESQKMGYWLTIVGSLRAFHLMITLPLILRFFRPKPRQAIALPVESSEPLHTSHDPTDASTPLTPPGSKPPTPPPTTDTARAALAGSHSHSRTGAHDSDAVWFDLLVARCSLAIEVIAEAGQALSPGPLSWTGSTLLGSFGGGFMPAMQSLALGLLAQSDETGQLDEIGRLFGAMSVMSAMCTQVMGPAIFGTIFALTAKVFPKAIFFVATCCVGTALLCLFCIRIYRPTPPVVVVLPAPESQGYGSVAVNERMSAEAADPEEAVLLNEDAARRVIDGEPPRGRTMSRGNGRGRVII